MAFSSGIRQTLYISALGSARQAGSAYDPAATARLLQRRNPSITNSFIDFFNLTRSAGLAHERGVALRGAGAPALPTRQHPIDPTLLGSPDRFRYRVVVRDANPHGAQYSETLITVDSPDKLDGDTIRARAISIAAEMHAAETDSPRARSFQEPASLAAIIVSAGRRD